MGIALDDNLANALLQNMMFFYYVRLTRNH